VLTERSHHDTTVEFGFILAGCDDQRLILTLSLIVVFAVPAGAIPLESWEDKIPAAGTRFKVLTEFGNAAVLDKETQLVWEQSPSLSTHTWFNARAACLNASVGGRKGWRLPTVHELASLIDPTQSNPALPVGHPFSNVQAFNYWSLSTVVDNAGLAWDQDLASGSNFQNGKVANFNYWCVRGGLNHSVQY
jgi:hypothetical protein